DVGPRVKPGGSLAATVTLKNTGGTTWQAGTVKLSFQGDGAGTKADMALSKKTKPNGTATFPTTPGASTQTRLPPLTWNATSAGTVFGTAISAKTEVTCSDGVFCNGDERWVNGKCVAGPMPCDDGQACTTDTCDETNRLCSHTLGSTCAACFQKNC